MVDADPICSGFHKNNKSIIVDADPICPGIHLNNNSIIVYAELPQIFT